MPIPNQIKRALEKSQLIVISEAVVVKSGHSIEKVRWIDAAGKQRTGFYKPVEEAGTYPALLAKFEVALHVRYQLSHGQIFPNDYLVFDEQSNIAGTVSEEIEGFHLFEDGPDFTVDFLIKNDVASIMVPSILMQCDDRHPQNYGYRRRKDGRYEFFIIDLDMAFYRYTVHIKGGREFHYDGLIRSISPHLFELSRYDLDNNPFVKEQRVHWPTHLPYNGNLKKVYKTSTTEALKALASEPKYHWQSLQRFAMHLVTYNSVCLKARLYERFGTLPLHYMSHVGARHGLSANFPDQFSPAQDHHPFVDTMMAIFDTNYQQEYREIVYYPGCVANAGGIAKISFHEFLMRTPKLLSKICSWVEAENHLLGDAMTPLHHDIDRIHSHFHAMWRDSFSLRIRAIMLNFREIQKRSAQKSLVLVDAAADAASMITSLYIPKEAAKDQDDQAQQQKMLVDCIEKLTKIFDRYFAVSADSSAALLAANQECCASLKGLLSQTETSLHQLFPAIDKVYRYVTMLLSHIDFSAYLSLESGRSKMVGSFDAMPTPSFHADEVTIVTSYIQRLFDWASYSRVLPVLLSSIETTMIKNTPSMANLYAARDERTDDISKYLKRVTSQQDSGDDASSSVSPGPEILAYILGNGKIEDNAFNTLLMHELFPKVLQDSYACFDIDVEGFLTSYYAGTLDMILYTTQVKSYIHSNKKYAALLIDETQRQFIRALYRWVDAMSPEVFREYVLETLRSYNSSRGMFYTYLLSTRAPDIHAALHDHTGSNGAILGLIFCKGGTNPASWKDVASFNYRLYHRLLEALFTEKRTNPSLLSRYSFPEGVSQELAGTFLQIPRFQEQALIQSKLANKIITVTEEQEDGFVLV